MFEHLPKITQGDLEFMKDVLIKKLIERPCGIDDFEEGWSKICEGLSPEYARALSAGAYMVAETLVEDPELKCGVSWMVGVAGLVILALVDRRLEQEELEKKLGL